MDAFGNDLLQAENSLAAVMLAHWVDHADRNAELIGAVRGGDLDTARAVNAALQPLTDAVMRTSQGAIMAKAALAELGVIPHATVRSPLLESPPEHLRRLRTALAPLRAGALVGSLGP